ncbi:MAG: GDSL-type esterase/lipase family protein, partial [Candidatus Gracilibacteria bacterium]|nr:GDSL-type esterase/lipase family protein [Candidatus Gracilibacteria bacterium]
MKKIFIILFMFLLFSCGNDIQTIENNQEILKTKKILSLGDSLTAGYGLDILESYPSKLQESLKIEGYNYEVINAGVSGNTSDDLLSRIKLYDDDYDIVIIVIGGNDGLRGNSLVNLEKNIQEIIDYFEGKNTKIVLGGLKQLPLNLGLNYIKEFTLVYEN